MLLALHARDVSRCSNSDGMCQPPPEVEEMRGPCRLRFRKPGVLPSPPAAIME
ncbi:MAG TPA: hypothetical protein DEF41_15240 [Desulfovibrio sp.]|uniref:Uncharacterized protein n=1 Tax=Nitratidesulfovibrio vulgaris (strain ATCC 29579 / DSM 644 / CCUG 34227 / NCIMB 8303 / VKM B-1760 / Hildenborough) TaxID=882 RepID=Q72F82_NITV2|nr:hypothetical protein DVU_0332 [Nitratidesulfovibrio vulgaris str. Hildenborough]HBW17429.1 hypothetical protein [Desulfovibrio sp.]